MSYNMCLATHTFKRTIYTHAKPSFFRTFEIAGYKDRCLLGLDVATARNSNQEEVFLFVSVNVIFVIFL